MFVEALKSDEVIAQNKSSVGKASMNFDIFKVVAASLNNVFDGSRTLKFWPHLSTLVFCKM